MKIELEEISERFEKAHNMVTRLCKRKGDPEGREWMMSIPARPDYDPDLVIGASLRDIPKLVTELARLSDEVEALKKERDEMFSRVTEITLKNEIWIQAESGGFVVRGRGLRTIRPTDARTVTGGDELVFPTVFEAFRALKGEQDREVG